MMSTETSETKTENLFRSFYGEDTFIEKSAIDKKCGFISKKGTRERGYPDFFLEKDDYAIIVEAKAEDHREAVDDIKFYMLNNKLKKDIIGIAISGQTMDEIKVSYFFKRGGGVICFY